VSEAVQRQPTGVHAPDAEAGATFALPGTVRAELVDLAATVLGELEEERTPAALARVRLFAPARRARAGAAPLTLALERDTGFRTAVAAAWRGLHPELATALDTGPDGMDGLAGFDAASVLAGLYLLRPPGWAATAAAVQAGVARAEQERARQDAEGLATARLRALEREAERLRSELVHSRAAATAARDELVAARREIRRLRADADRARAAARAAAQESQAERARAGEAVAEAEREVARERDLARRAQERAEQSVRAGREGRSLAEARLRLLLDTVVEAAAGLRRELALPPLDVRPADLVGGVQAEAGSGGTGESLRGRPPDDPAQLAELLALPQAHVLVDGYNVTKAGYAGLPLVEQRRRLVDALGPLAARTGAEVTCVFDGADVEGRSAQRLRGVRVLFSEPGTTADDLLRRLVRAEPPGRPVVVVSNDKEVVTGIRASGARAVPSGALLRLLSRS
jgi:predicted RNA-binding protein with PIN domain